MMRRWMLSCPPEQVQRGGFFGNLPAHARRFAYGLFLTRDGDPLTGFRVCREAEK